MKTILFLLLLFTQISSAQQKYLVFFTDKGIPRGSILAKGSSFYNEAVSLLTERSLERRMKNSENPLITYEDIPVRTDYIDSLRAAGIEISNTLKWFNAVSAYMTTEQVNSLKKFSFVEKIEPVRVFRADRKEYTTSLSKTTITDSAFYGHSYIQLKLSDIPQVHSKNITGKGVIMGVLDSGFKWKTHEALLHANVIAEYDFIFDDTVTENQSPDVTNQHNHGTSVFSVIAGKEKSVLIGAAYDAAFLLAKTEDIRSETRIEEDNYAAALEWMESYGVDITTASLGYNEFDNFKYSYSDMDGKTTIVTKAAELAFEKGVLVINSAGNEGDDLWRFITAPADGKHVISVGAVTSANRVAGFSGRGPTYDGRIKPDVVAMGVSVFGVSAPGSNQYGLFGGTSLSAPIAAGCAALLLEAHPYLTNVQMRDIILRTAGNYQFPDNDRGYGLISAARAIEYPHIVNFNGEYFINKTFLDVQPENVKLFFSADRKVYTEQVMQTDSLHYSYRFPANLLNHVVSFYYTYRNSQGQEVRAPESGYYTAIYGDMTSVKYEDLPTDYILSNNYPNPFNNSTRINFYLNDFSDVELEIFDILGQKVKTLFKAENVSGEYSFVWNGRNDRGLYAPSGVYIYRLRAGGQEFSKKMVLLK